MLQHLVSEDEDHQELHSRANRALTSLSAAPYILQKTQSKSSSSSHTSIVQASKILNPNAFAIAQQEESLEPEQERPMRYYDGQPVYGDIYYFEDWVNSQKYKFMRKTDENTWISHSSQNGYVLEIPDREPIRLAAYRRLAKDFHQAIHKMYNLSECLVDTENRGPELLLFAFQELDCPPVEKEFWTLENQVKVARIYCETLAQFMLHDQPFLVYLSLRQHLPDYLAQNNVFGQNMHFQTNICTTVEKAQRVHALFVHNLQQQMERPTNVEPPWGVGETPWEKIVDPLVLQENKLNLRLNYTTKISKCKDCFAANEKVKGDCRLCGDTKKVITHQFYRVVKVFNRQGEEDPVEFARIRDDMVKELAATSIRPYENASANLYFQIPIDCPPKLSYSLVKNTYGDMKFGKKSEGNAVNPKIPAAGRWNQRHKVLNNSHPQAQGCLRAIRKSHIGFNKLELRKVEESTSGKAEIRVMVRGYGCNFCLNRVSRDGTILGQKHESMNTLWFSFSNNSMYQKCRASGGLENRIKGECPKFARKLNLDYAEAKIIFPAAKYRDDELEVKTNPFTESKSAAATPLVVVAVDVENTAMPAIICKSAKKRKSTPALPVVAEVVDIDAPETNYENELAEEQSSQQQQPMSEDTRKRWEKVKQAAIKREQKLKKQEQKQGHKAKKFTQDNFTFRGDLPLSTSASDESS